MGSVFGMAAQSTSCRRINSRTAGRSAAWLARLPWEQEVGGSNPLAPITRTLLTANGLILDLSVANSSSCRDWCLIQATTVLLPSIRFQIAQA
jgi:hypothetical protein